MADLRRQRGRGNAVGWLPRHDGTVEGYGALRPAMYLAIADRPVQPGLRCTALSPGAFRFADFAAESSAISGPAIAGARERGRGFAVRRAVVRGSRSFQEGQRYRRPYRGRSAADHRGTASALLRQG